VNSWQIAARTVIVGDQKYGDPDEAGSNLVEEYYRVDRVFLSGGRDQRKGDLKRMLRVIFHLDPKHFS